MPNTIRLYADRDGQYYADYADHVDAAKMRRIFATTHVPLPYCVPHPLAQAAAVVQRFHPDAIILITSDPTQYATE